MSDLPGTLEGIESPIFRADLSEAMRSTLPQLGDDIVAEIRRTVPDYSQPLEGNFGQAVQMGVEEALKRFVDVLAEGSGDAEAEETWRRVYFNLGRGEEQQGRSLEALLAAYRAGARVSWRRMAEAAGDAGATQDELTVLAEAIFAYIDELSAVSARGYASEQATRAGETQRRRERLVRLLAEGASPDTIEPAAADAGWSLPASAAVLVVRAPGEAPGVVAGRLGVGAIAGPLADELICVVIPDPEAPGRLRELGQGLRGAAAAIGPAGEPGKLPRSLERARTALVLAERGLIAAPAPVRAEDHMAELIVHGDQALLAEHTRRLLEPLDALTPAARQRMLETLAAWLDNPRRPTDVAAAVHVHPQTARYRLGRLRELLGDIDSPNRRFQLTLAMHGVTPPAAITGASI